MAINTQKVIVGGVAAGFAVGVVDSFVNGFLLASQNDAALNAIALPPLERAAGLHEFLARLEATMPRAFWLAIGHY